MSEWEKWERLSFYMLLAYNTNTNFLINTGFPVDLGLRREKMRKSFGSESYIVSKDSIKQLELNGFQPDDIENVAFTPIQDYTCGRLPEFVNATIFLNKKGWLEDIVNPIHSEIKDPTLYMPRNVRNFIEKRPPSYIKYFESDHGSILIPGITAISVGCHHRSSTAFAINTKNGIVVFSDAVFKYKNLEKMIPIGIAESIIECLDVYTELKKIGYVIPAYDPKSLENLNKFMKKETDDRHK